MYKITIKEVYEKGIKIVEVYLVEDGKWIRKARGATIKEALIQLVCKI